MFCDAHFHLVQSLKHTAGELFAPLVKNASVYRACTCAHDKAEFLQQSESVASVRAGENADKVVLYSSFGLHPQNPILENALFLESLLQQDKLDAVGEAGFDLFTPEFKQNIENQKKAWNIELELAMFYKRPLVLHGRKAADLIFAESKRLKKIPAVLFHSFPGSRIEALSLLNRGINGFFSFGKQVLNNNKKVIDCASHLPLENLLLETDAPFQTLKGEVFTKPEELMKVYDEVLRLRVITKRSEKIAFCEKLEKNFITVFGKNPTGC